ncbi:MAG: polyprenyl synthetase family protein [Candidatus Hydrogenedentes bacterium]|nr:polyprenyl synthetase family protein [Candidatus Hydrogenedentota bacterium]
MPTTLTLQELYKPIQSELEQVRAETGKLWEQVIALVDGAASPRPRNGGKLLRPALCLLSAGAAGTSELSRFVPLAAAMELFHIAALAHDDVIDGSQLRRGAPSLNAMWNEHAAVLAGDYLVARGMALMASYNSCRAIVDGARCIQHMAEGELVDFGAGPGHFTRDGCIELARAKTASLFAVACATPAFFIDPTYWQPLHEFGLALGIAFQLIDDLLDLSQGEDALGKPACGDLAAGKKTLPILFMRESLEPDGLARLDAMRNARVSPDDRRWVAETLETSGARHRTEAVAREYADEARRLLTGLPPGLCRDAMAGLTEFTIVRGA